MGYTSKYNSITYSNGATIVVIQGHGWHSGSTINSLSPEEFVSLVLSLIPVVGDIKDVIESVSGYDVITGEPLSLWERILCIGCSIIPIVNGTAVRIGKKGFAKLDNVLECTDKLTDIQRAAVRTDIWNVLRPITRGLCVESDFARRVYKLVDGWHHIGKEMNGFFPVIDFIKFGDNIDDTISISLKTMDPRLYKLADGSYNMTRIKYVINQYIAKLKKTPIHIDNHTLLPKCKKLELVVPVGYAEMIRNMDFSPLEGIIFTITEFYLFYSK